MFGWIKAIWQIRVLKKSLCTYQNEHSDRLPLLLDVVCALGKVAEALKREGLAQWTKNELEGYAADQVVPAYRHLKCEYRGDVQKYGKEVQKDSPLSKVVCEQHLHEWDISFTYTANLLEAVDTVENQNQTVCPLKTYHNFQVVDVYNLQAGYEVFKPRCVCSMQAVRDMLMKISGECESRIQEIERCYYCLWKIDGVFVWVHMRRRLIGFILLLLILIGGFVFGHGKIKAKYVPPVCQDYLPEVVLDREAKGGGDGHSLSDDAALSNETKTFVLTTVTSFQERVEIVDKKYGSSCMTVGIRSRHNLI